MNDATNTTITTRHGTFLVSRFANLFRRYSPEELAELAADIKRLGKLSSPVLRCKRTGEIDDGVNRLLACDLADVVPEIVDHDLTDEERLDEVIRRNKIRRHLGVPELAALSTELLKLEKVLAEERQRRGRPKAGEDLPPTSADDTSKELPPTSAEDTSKGEVAEIVGKKLGIGKGAVRAASRIAAKAPDVLIAMRAGEVTSMEQAKSLAELPPRQRGEILAAPVSERTQKLRERVRSLKGQKNAKKISTSRPEPKTLPTDEEIEHAVVALLGVVSRVPAPKAKTLRGQIVSRLH